MNKSDLEKDNQALRKEVAHLIDTNQKLQTQLENTTIELYNTQIMELNKRRELDVAQALLAEKSQELASNSQSSPSLSESSSPSQE